MSVGFWKTSALAAVLLLAAASAPSPVRAQTSIVAIVNGTAITSTEVNERRAVLRLTQKKNLSNKEALDQLIDIVLIFNEAQRRNIRIAESDVEARFAGIAQNAKMSVDQLGKALAQSGASARAFKQEIRHSLLQRRMGGMLSRTATGVSEKEIAAGITAKRSDSDSQAYRFTMQQVVFVTPSGAKPGVIAQRKREAESLRTRISSCEQAASIAKELRDVAVKPPVTRVSAQLPQTFRDQLSAMKVGQSTKPEPNELGVEIIVMCNKQETTDDTALRNEVQSELIATQGKAEVDKFVADLRRRAVIVYR